MESVSVPSDSQASTAALPASPDVTPDATTPVIVTAWVSVRSTSLNVMEPVTVSSAVEPVGCGWPGLTASVKAALVVATTGVSLVPVTVIVKTWNVVSLFGA